jgi:hypothetical protein
MSYSIAIIVSFGIAAILVTCGIVDHYRCRVGGPRSNLILSLLIEGEATADDLIEWSAGCLRHGSIHATLRNMEEAGLIRWRPDERALAVRGIPCHLHYSLTTIGRGIAAQQAKAVARG